MRRYFQEHHIFWMPIFHVNWEKVLQKDSFPCTVKQSMCVYPFDILKLFVYEEGTDEIVVTLILGTIQECQIKVVLHAKVEKVTYVWSRHDQVVANTGTNEIGNLSRIWKCREEKFWKSMFIQKKQFIFGWSDVYLPQHAQTQNGSSMREWV